jgi:hypothetical protein
MPAGFWCENLKSGGQLESLGFDVRGVLIYIFNKEWAYGAAADSC